MIAIRAVAAPPPSHGARAPLSSVPRRATASGAATGQGMEVVLGHPTPYAPGDISVGEAVSTAHQALSQAQRILHREGTLLMSADACSCGQACSRGRWCLRGRRRGPGSMVLTCRWRPSLSMTPTPGGPLSMHGSCMHISRGSGQRRHQAGGGPCCARTPGQPVGAGGGKAEGVAAGAGGVGRHHPPARAQGPEHPRDQPRPP
jgi:hypothetical protein